MVLSPLQSKIKDLTEDPGVYLMKNAGGEILYVGKAKNLKNRVSSYFQESKAHTSRIQLLVRRIASFDIVITDTEVEALILECNLIKKYRPRFNVRLKDDKSYPYVRLDLKHGFPRLEYTRKVRKDGARYFGPYVSSYQLKDLLTWARKTFRFRDCSDNEFRNRSRPCILYQIGQCTAPCVGYITEADYGQSIQYVLKILDNKTSEVIKDLTRDMEVAAEAEEFERAAALRDRLKSIEDLAENQSQKMSDPESEVNRDVVHFARQDNQAVVVVMAVHKGMTVGVFQFPFTDLDPEMPDHDFLFQFLAQYYILKQESKQELQLNEPGPALPEEVLLPEGSIPHLAGSVDVKEQYNVLSRALSRRVDFRIPKRGEAANLVALVSKTAEYHLSELAKNRTQAEEDLADLQKRLNLTRFPRRIECFDISHFQGEGTVASRVVFIEGKPEKSLYRHYHVTEVEGPDDFRSMLEVLRRRFENATVGETGEGPAAAPNSIVAGNSLPDLLILDGGRGQLAQAELIFAELGITGVDLVSLAKARTESDFQDAEVTATMERVFKPQQKNPIMLKPGTGAFRVMTQARDESHRFAITFHRKVRDRRRVLSKKE